MLPIQLLFSNPLVFVFFAVALLLSLSIHESAHAFVADKLGDPTARYLGRVTLNPLAHLDKIGTLLLLFAGFGWGKPVPFNPNNLKNPKRDSALISFAGPGSNFLLAVLFAVIYRLVGVSGHLGFFAFFLYLLVFYNLVLAFFNLIPLHPLDGFKVVNGLLPEGLSLQWIETARYGIFILLILVLTNTISKILDPLLKFSMNLLGIKS